MKLFRILPDWILKNRPVRYADLITEPGIDGVLSDENQDIQGVLRKIELSMKKHHTSPSLIFIAGHSDCRSNSVSDDVHKEHIIAGVRRLKRIYLDKEITGLWVSLKQEVSEIN